MPKIKVKDQTVQTGQRPQTNGRTHGCYNQTYYLASYAVDKNCKVFELQSFLSVVFVVKLFAEFRCRGTSGAVAGKEGLIFEIIHHRSNINSNRAGDRRRVRSSGVDGRGNFSVMTAQRSVDGELILSEESYVN